MECQHEIRHAVIILYQLKKEIDERHSLMLTQFYRIEKILAKKRDS
jgi:hypothetical protein